jgi:hypothetical protein
MNKASFCPSLTQPSLVAALPNIIQPAPVRPRLAPLPPCARLHVKLVFKMIQRPQVFYSL